MRQRPNTVCSKCRSVGRWANNLCPICIEPVARARAAYKSVRYGSEHKKLRGFWVTLIRSGIPINCARCKKPIAQGNKWHLDHLPDGTSAPSHEGCNGKASHTDGNRK